MLQRAPKRTFRRLVRFDRKGILERCDELLRFLYAGAGTTKQTCSDPVQDMPEFKRVLGRLCLVGRADDNLAQALPRQVTPTIASNLIRHARSCCTDQNPRCSECPLISFCPTGIDGLRKSLSGKAVSVDLFAGAGGLSAGFRHEGFHVALAIEKDKNAAQSYRVNNPGVPVLEADVRRIRPRDILRLLRYKRGEITAVIGGPPCQGFSAAGPRRPMARRNFLYRSFGAMSHGLGVSFLVMENVPGLKRVNGVGFQDRILAHFRDCGYVGKAVELDASKFGVPQRRKRVFFVCTRRGFRAAPTKLRPIKKKGNPSVAQALTGLPRPRLSDTKDGIPGQAVALWNHRAMVHSNKVVRKIRKIEPGSGPISYRRLRLDLAHTIIAGHRAMPVHPRQHRTITVREAARIQTMPDWFCFLGPHSEQPLQIANVVPFDLARATARTLLFAMKRPVHNFRLGPNAN